MQQPRAETITLSYKGGHRYARRSPNFIKSSTDCHPFYQIPIFTENSKATPLNTAAPDPERLARIAAGDESAFRELFDQYWGNLYAVAFAFTKSVPISQDIVQEIFIKVWQKRTQLAGLDRFDNWLFITARNHILNTLRRSSRQPSFTLALAEYFQAAGNGPEEQLLFRESQGLVRQAIAQLPSQQKKIWLLSREQGLTQDEIAAQLNIAKNTVKSHMNKALQSIRDYLKTHTDETLFLVCILHAFL